MPVGALVLIIVFNVAVTVIVDVAVIVEVVVLAMDVAVLLTEVLEVDGTLVVAVLETGVAVLLAEVPVLVCAVNVVRIVVWMDAAVFACDDAAAMLAVGVERAALVDVVVVSAIKTAAVSTPFTSTATLLPFNEAFAYSAILTLRNTTSTVILLQCEETERMSSCVNPSVFKTMLSTVAISTACKSAVSQSA